MDKTPKHDLLVALENLKEWRIEELRRFQNAVLDDIIQTANQAKADTAGTLNPQDHFGDYGMIHKLMAQLDQVRKVYLDVEFSQNTFLRELFNPYREEV